MRYELRTTFTLPSGDPNRKEEIGRANRLLRWLYEYLPTQAAMGCDLAPPRWTGNRYTSEWVEFEVVTEYRDVFAATADRLRIEQALAGDPPEEVSNRKPDLAFEVRRVYGDSELVDTSEPTKKLSHPC